MTDSEQVTEISQPIIDDQPFPGVDDTTEDVGGSSNNTAEALYPPEIPPRRFPQTVIAHQVISNSLDSMQRRILGEYTFSVNGAIAIGRYENGISGDIRITPNGIVARNSDGTVTVSIDGTTGDATFAGQLLTGTLITGDIQVGNNTWVISGDPDTPRILLYNSGIPEIVIGEV